MAKQIKFEHKGVKYTLEFSRNTVKKMENSGFNIMELDTKLMTRLPELFAGAFLMHHSRVKQEIVDEILYDMKDRQALVKRLCEMYTQPYEDLLPSEGDDSGNISWTME